MRFPSSIGCACISVQRGYDPEIAEVLNMSLGADSIALGDPWRTCHAVKTWDTFISTRISLQGNGRFLLDGLPDGSCQISAFAPGYPKTKRLLAGPRRLNIKEKSCVRHIFVLPKP